VKIEVELDEKYHQAGKIVFEQAEPGCPADIQEQLEQDLKALLTVFGGLALAVSEEAKLPHAGSGEFIRRLMDNLEEFAKQRLERGAA
jgi:hypothetical protein